MFDMGRSTGDGAVDFSNRKTSKTPLSPSAVALVTKNQTQTDLGVTKMTDNTCVVGACKRS